MKTLVVDYVAELRAAKFSPVPVPAYLDGRGSPIVVRNGEGWPIIRLPSADGWRDELTYWYRRGSDGPCRTCMAPCGRMLLTVSPAYAVDIESEGQALSIAAAWKLGRAPRVGRIVKYPYGRVLRKSLDMGRLHPDCLIQAMTQRGWLKTATSGRHADAQTWAGLADGMISDVTLAPVERGLTGRDRPCPETWRREMRAPSTARMQLDRPMKPEHKETAAGRRRMVRPERTSIVQVIPE